MNETILIQIRVDEQLKTDAADVLDRLGLDIPTAVRMFLKRIVLEQGLPFSTVLPKTDIMQNNKEKVKVIHIPAKKSVKIPREIVEYLIRQVPAGKITRYEDIQQFLQTAYGYERVELEHESGALFLQDTSFPYWRVVGSTGFLPSRHKFYDDKKMAELLRADGLSISMGGARNALYRVDNYKKHLYDFNGIQLIPEEHITSKF